MPELLQLRVEAFQLAKQDSKQLFEAAGFKKAGSRVITHGGLTGYGELNNVITFMECHHFLILKFCV
ncbi:rCG46755, isoform CRA_a [Rattus norvegicus]|uniref:RCG46755, isoform CRA_a n=1 Tax=Rattus norvegicus TaxID=10116 RepID=A6IWY7_RAT|nr:rCG46755, isoform CRA_a [Rattus norvegicus]